MKQSVKFMLFSKLISTLSLRSADTYFQFSLHLSQCEYHFCIYKYCIISVFRALEFTTVFLYPAIWFLWSQARTERLRFPEHCPPHNSSYSWQQIHNLLYQSAQASLKSIIYTLFTIYNFNIRIELDDIHYSRGFQSFRCCKLPNTIIQKWKMQLYIFKYKDIYYTPFFFILLILLLYLYSR